MGEGYLLHQLMASNTSEEDEADVGEEVFCVVEYTKIGRAAALLTQPVKGRGCTTAGGSSH